MTTIVTTSVIKNAYQVLDDDATSNHRTMKYLGIRIRLNLCKGKGTSAKGMRRNALDGARTSSHSLLLQLNIGTSELTCFFFDITFELPALYPERNNYPDASNCYGTIEKVDG